MDNNIYITKPNNTQSRLKIWALRVIIIGIPLAVALTVVFYLGIFGFIQVTFGGSVANLSLVSDGGSKTIAEYKSGSSQLVKKNNYSATLKNNDGSYVTTVSTKGFLKKSTMDADLTPEAAASIIGTNPYQCTLTIGGVLYSYRCVTDSELKPLGNEVTTFKKQYLDQTKNIINTSSIDIFNYNQQLLSLLKTSDTQVWMIVRVNPAGDADDTDSKIVTELRQYSNGDFTTPTKTRVLDNNQLTGMQAYQDGVIIYSKDSVDAHYLSSFDATLQKIPFSTLPIIDGYGFDIAIKGEFSSYYYKNRVRDDQMPKKVKNLSISSVYKLDQPKITPTKYLYTSAFMCADNTLCIYLQNKGQFIIQDEKQKSLYQVSGFDIYKEKLLLNMNNNVVLYDIQNNSGYIVYAGSVNSSICGIQIVRSEVRLCVDSQASGDTYAILLDFGKQKEVNIIEAMNVIAKNNHVDYITAISNTIFINTSLSQTYDTTSKTYNVDENMRQYAVKTINQAVKDAGLDTTKYKVIIN